MEKAITKYLDLLQSNELIIMATVNDDGTPQTSPVWFFFENNEIWINSAKGRLKDRNLRARPYFSGTVVDPKNPYRYVEVRGEVYDIKEVGADADIDFLANRYMGVDTYPYHSDQETRVTYRIRPTHVTGKS